MTARFKTIPLLVSLVLFADICLAEETYSSSPDTVRRPTSPKRKDSPSSDPDLRWAQQYYTGKRLAGQTDKAKPIVTVTTKKTSDKSRATKPDETATAPSLAEKPVEVDAYNDDDVTEKQRSAGYLPSGIDTGVSNLESGLLSLRGYTTEMGSHIQKNGLKGFLYLTPELKNEGQQVGKKIGGGVRSIMQDVGNEMAPVTK